MSDTATQRHRERAPSSWIGDYEILEHLGSGGMGDVYRAHDRRLGRDVALKVLPEGYANDSERARRLVREARAASALHHPNIVTVYEVAADGPRAYIAMELVAGRTLRQLIGSGPLGVRKLLELAAQAASGLAHAHAAGLAHRDLKPENLMVSREGILKILDFGLAKRVAFEGGAAAADATASIDTDGGAIVGTVGYMSPEQAEGGAVDARSDQFALGSILYEMATGRRAFERPSKPETLTAILREDPPPMGSLAPDLPTPLCWIVERCLAKDPAARYASTDDLARDLADLRDRSSQSRTSGKATAAGHRPHRALRAVVAALLLAAVSAAAYWLGRRSEGVQAGVAHWERLTFRHEGITAARFAPDGRTVIYSAAREGAPLALFSARFESPEVRPLELERASILAVSPTAELAVLLDRGFGRFQRPPHDLLATERDPRLLYGVLARVPLAGGVPRELLDDVRDADWDADGRELAVIRFVDGVDQLEYPVGHALHRSNAWLDHPRVSPAKDRVAFVSSYTVMVVDLGGSARSLASDASELAWSPTGEEIWYSRVSAETTEIRAVSLAGRDRLVGTLPGDFVLEDIGRDGRLLLGQVFESSQILGSFAGESRERNLSWLDRSSAVVISDDARTLLFTDSPTEPNELRGIYLRATDGGPAKRLGEGGAVALSRDGRYVLVAWPAAVLLPTGAGPTLPLAMGQVAARGRGDFFPDGARVFLMGQEPGHGIRGYVVDVAGGLPRAITPEGTRRGLLSGDGRYVTAKAADGDWYLYPTTAGEATLVAGLHSGEEPMQWSSDEPVLYVRGADQLAAGESHLGARVYRLDPWSGLRELWREIPPVDPTHGGEIGKILIADRGRVCIYNHHRFSTDLFVVDHWR